MRPHSIAVAHDGFTSGDTTTSDLSTPSLWMVNELINGGAERAGAWERQRSDVRYPLGVVLQIGRSGNEATFTPTCDVLCLDVSYQGVRLIAQQVLMTGRFLRLDMSPLLRKPCVVELQVLACKAMTSSLDGIRASFYF